MPIARARRSPPRRAVASSCSATASRSSAKASPSSAISRTRCRCSARASASSAKASPRPASPCHALPAATKTRRGRLLLRSVVVGFVLVATWIAVIVGLQLHGNDVPDFRPTAEKILVEIGKGSASIGEVYEKASPRFQEMVRKERFIDEMTDLNTTLGKFIEVTAINDTLVTSGPAGRVGRVSITASYANGICKGSISFHWDQGQWKLLGIGIELPPDAQDHASAARAACRRVQGLRRSQDLRRA